MCKSGNRTLKLLDILDFVSPILRICTLICANKLTLDEKYIIISSQIDKNFTKQNTVRNEDMKKNRACISAGACTCFTL